ncbi:MAG: single-stranded-DNA-specific exonuclease RecJ [Mariprofundaceae bacterium]|nr:single-stranded-DNA-specific exonuclease RecJ [Mariprofundaceae bacterium]
MDIFTGKRSKKGQAELAWRHQALSTHDPLAAWQGVLTARGLHESDAFFNPALSGLPDPFLMVDMDKAAQRLADAVQNKEKMHVFGDFDCDGVSGTSILVDALSAAGVDVMYSIPHRADDGHGIGVDAVRAAHQAGVTLGLSVDTGTTCLAASDEAITLGFDLMITDHHLPDAVLPKAFALLNPARQDCGFADRVLCGTGVAFFLLMATWKVLSGRGQRPAYDLKQLLDRVAMATVADVMELRGVNRILVHHGLQQLKTSPSIGMSALMDSARVKRQRISTESFGFYMAPRINAAGRMRHGEEAMRLLCCQDPDEAVLLAKGLDNCNQERRKIETDTYKEAVGKLQDLQTNSRSSSQEEFEILAVYDNHWHAGVVGLVAGRLARQHGRPAAVGFVDNDNNIRVSLRGKAGFHVGDLLHACAEHLSGFGGHAGAGGGTVKAASWNAFVLDFTKAVQQQQRDGGVNNHLLIDGVLTLEALHIGLARRLQKFEPVGHGNPACLWLLPEVQVLEMKKLKGGVLRLRLGDDTSFANAVVFGGSALEEDLQAGLTVSLLGKLQPDDFRGGDAVQFVVEDVLV